VRAKRRTVEPVTTSEIRTALIACLTREPKTHLRREFAHDTGRVDILAVGETLHCYEIKSDTDSLGRVQSQVDSFSQYCEALTFVGGPRLAIKLLRETPSWCGVWLAHRSPRGLVLTVLRLAKTNPRADARATLHILSAVELRRMSVLLGQSRPKTKLNAINSLAPVLPLARIRRYVTASLKRRAAGRLAGQQVLNGDSLLPEPTWSGYQFGL